MGVVYFIAFILFLFWVMDGCPNWFFEATHLHELEITQLMYIDCDTYWITNKCRTCGCEKTGLVRYPYEILYHQDQLKLPNIKGE